MARPKKNNAEYFTHDADMRNDVKIKALRRKFQHTGYAVWNFLLESLTDSDYFEIERNAINLELLAADYDVSVETLNEIIDYCLKIGLLQEEDNRLFSEAHKRRFAPLLANRERKRVITDNNIAETQKKGVTACRNTGKTDENDVSAAENPHSKVKESKVKESKVNKSLSISPSFQSGDVESPTAKPSDAERERIFEIFFFEKNCKNPQKEFDTFIHHYEANGWCRKDSTTPVRDRLALARNWKTQSEDKHFPEDVLKWVFTFYIELKKSHIDLAKQLIHGGISQVDSFNGSPRITLKTRELGICIKKFMDKNEPEFKLFIRVPKA